MREALLLSIGRLVCTTPWFIICCVPFYPQRRVTRRTMVVVITVASALFFLCNFYLRFWREDYAVYASTVFLILYIVMVGFFIWGFRAAPVKLLYVFLLVQAISTAINYTAAIILRPFHPGIRISLQSTVSYTLVIFLLTLVVAPVLWYFFFHQLREAMEVLRNRDFLLLCIPPVLMFVVTVLFNDVGTNPKVPQEAAIAIFLLIMAAGLVTYYINVRLALDTARHSQLEANVTVMEQQIAMQGQSYIKLTQSIEEARAMRHDLRHHLAMMAAFVEHGNMDGLTGYLTEYRQSLPEEHNFSVCGNHAVDVVVRHYLQQAREADATLDVKLDLPAEMGIRDTDLTIVFGNLFENAAQSVARQRAGERFIQARCGIEQGQLILTVDNSTGPQSRSGEGTNAGLGIGQTSVKAVAHKYQGTVRFIKEEDVYRASVLLVVKGQLPA